MHVKYQGQRSVDSKARVETDGRTDTTDCITVQWRNNCVGKVRAYSKRVPRTNCALRIKKCAPRISSGIYFLSTS